MGRRTGSGLPRCIGSQEMKAAECDAVPVHVLKFYFNLTPDSIRSNGFMTSDSYYSIE